MKFENLKTPNSVSMTGIIFLLLLAISANRAVELGRECFIDADCHLPNSHCRFAVKTCGSGMCHCSLGFRQHNESCKREVMLGFRCRVGVDVCRSENAACLYGRCTCTNGFKRGVHGNDCVSQISTRKFNETCHNDTECSYNMICSEGRCQCGHAFRYGDETECIERKIGDYCEKLEDCQHMKHSACVYHQCTCQAGYKRMQYLTPEGVETLLCAPIKHRLRMENEMCDISNGHVCKSPFVCVECTVEKSICTRPAVLLSGSWSVEWLVRFFDYVIARLMMMIGL